MLGSIDNHRSRSCSNELFYIYISKGSDSSGEVKHGQQIYLKRYGCNWYASGKNGKWVQAVSNLGRCEKWTLEKA